MTSSAHRVCVDCGRTDRAINRRITGWTICWPCTRRRQKNPAPCPACGNVRVLAIPRDGQAICTSCAGIPSPLACPRCGNEGHPYARLCAYCTLTDRATNLLTDPATGLVHERLHPLLDTWTSSRDPRTQIRWLAHAPLSTDLLRAMAHGEVPISHDTFQTLPPAKPYDYLRNLLVTLNILEPWEPHIDRFTVWLDTQIIPTLAPEHVQTIRAYARWHVLRGLGRRAHRGTLTQAAANSARIRVRAAIEFCELLAHHNTTITDATQSDLEDFITSAPGYNRTKTIASFVAWARKTRTNPNLTTPGGPWPHAAVNVSDTQHWNDIDRFLHQDTIASGTRLAGLFTLLFAQPLNRIVAMTTSQVHITADQVFVTFADDPIQMPPILDDLLHDHITNNTAPPTPGDTAHWLFPGAQPGRHLVTEVFRRELTTHGIKPYESRKAAMFHLATTMPAPILAGLLGITNKNAATWADLAARDWNTYINHRSQDTPPRAIHAP